MNTGQIMKKLDCIDSFVGAFPCNMIQEVTTRPAAYVVNTAPYHRVNKKIAEGKHWVAIILKEGSKGEYFDSFGLPPSGNYLTSFVSRFCRNGFVFNSTMLQSPLSQICGVWCCDFLIQRSEGTSMAQYVESFTSDLDANDRTVVERTGCQW